MQSSICHDSRTPWYTQLPSLFSSHTVHVFVPSGTGKSVTGAHIAYALAMKLRKEVENAQRKTEDLNSCVMYCGPSQQSVNVVLGEL